jgi:RHS repeat-associated protein
VHRFFARARARAREAVGVAGATTTTLVRAPTTGLAVSQTENSTKRFLLQDQLGSTIALTDSTGAFARSYTYSPDGIDSTGGSGPSALVRFAGGHLLSGGLYHFGARYYSPAVGRWTQQDAIDRIADLREGNLYVYAGDDPLNYVDPSGQGIGDVLKTAGKAVATVGLAAGTVASGVATGAATAGCFAATRGIHSFECFKVAAAGGTLTVAAGRATAEVGRTVFNGR